MLDSALHGDRHGSSTGGSTKAHGKCREERPACTGDGGRVARAGLGMNSSPTTAQGQQQRTTAKHKALLNDSQSLTGEGYYTYSCCIPLIASYSTTHLKALSGLLLDSTSNVNGRAINECAAKPDSTVARYSPRLCSSAVMLHALSMVLAIREAMPTGVTQMTQKICMHPVQVASSQ